MAWLPARGEDMTLALKQISSSSLVQLQLKAELSFTCTFPMVSVQGCMLSSLQRLPFCLFPLSWLQCSTVYHSLSNLIFALTLAGLTERLISEITQFIICLILFSISKYLIPRAGRQE